MEIAMTQERRDGGSTEFGLWLRRQPEIDSNLGYIASNIDYVWKNWKADTFMLIEEKRYGWAPKHYQWKIYEHIDSLLAGSKGYYGFHLLIFENTNPDDGKVWLDGDYITSGDLVEFLQYNKPDKWYVSYFPRDRYTLKRIGTP
jgi:hypothetical protein